jgi:hypothetical protein
MVKETRKGTSTEQYRQFPETQTTAAAAVDSEPA